MTLKHAPVQISSTCSDTDILITLLNICLHYFVSIQLSSKHALVHISSTRFHTDIINMLLYICLHYVVSIHISSTCCCTNILNTPRYTYPQHAPIHMSSLRCFYTAILMLLYRYPQHALIQIHVSSTRSNKIYVAHSCTDILNSLLQISWWFYIYIYV